MIKRTPLLIRWLRREEAAEYLRVCPSKFDQLRKAGNVPPARRFHGILLFDSHELDGLLLSIRPEGAANDNNEWDAVHASR